VWVYLFAPISLFYYRLNFRHLSVTQLGVLDERY